MTIANQDTAYDLTKFRMYEIGVPPPLTAVFGPLLHLPYTIGIRH